LRPSNRRGGANEAINLMYFRRRQVRINLDYSTRFVCVVAQWI
jgi:hypothetical protein